MEAFLAEHSLAEYWPAFEAAGWDDVSQLHSCSTDELNQVVHETNMKSGHVNRLLKGLDKAAPPPSPQTPTPPRWPPQQEQQDQLASWRGS
jgi:hypothetical protein